MTDHAKITGNSSPEELLGRPSPLDELAARSLRLANVVEATSRRRDVRELRARILLLLCALRCPERGTPKRSWYVPGAVARLGAEGLARAWRGFFGGRAPSVRTFRSHLGALRQACAIATSPGDWLPWLYDAEHPERRPRFADTIHLLEDDAAAEWWAGPGAELLRLHGEARWNPDRWRSIFGGWRREAAARGQTRGQLELFAGFEERGRGGNDGIATAAPGRSSTARTHHPVTAAPSAGSPAELAAGFGALALGGGNAFELLAGCRALGTLVQGRSSFELAQDPGRLAGAVALLAVALARGDRIRNRAGWLVRNYRHARETELDRARARVRGWTLNRRPQCEPNRSRRI